MGQVLLVDSRKIESFEGLHQAVHGSHVDVMQLGRGRMRGALSHVGIGDFSLSIGASDGSDLAVQDVRFDRPEKQP